MGMGTRVEITDGPLDTSGVRQSMLRICFLLTTFWKHIFDLTSSYIYCDSKIYGEKYIYFYG